jgi:hypothetical protein
MRGSAEAVVVTQEPSGLDVRVFDGYSYSPSYAKNRFLKLLRKLQANVATTYDDDNGFNIWGLDA